MKYEHRQVEIRVQPNVEGPQQDGLPRQFWARVLNYEVVDDYGTKFRYGAAKESLQRRLPRLMYGHAGWENPAALLGRGIDYRDSKEGLDVLFEFDDFDFVPMGRQIAHQMSNDPDNPTLDQFSIGFIRQRDTRDTDGKTVITKMRLGETSVVVEGSVPGTKLLAFRSSNDGAGNEGMPFNEGAVMDANDAARIIARFSLGELDLAQALDMVKASVILEDEDEKDDEEKDDEKDDASDEDATKPDADSDPPPADPPQEDAGGDSQANDSPTPDATAEEPPASETEEEDPDEITAEEQAEIDALLASVDSDLADVELVARHAKVETRDFQGNQHAGSKADTGDVLGTMHVNRLADTPEADHTAWESKPAGSLVAAGAGASPVRITTSRTKMWREGGWTPHLAFTTEVGGKVVGSTSSIEAAKKLAGDAVVWTDRG